MDTHETMAQHCWNKTDLNIYPECFQYLQAFHSGDAYHHHKPKIISVVFLAILILLCLIGNSLVLIAFVMYRRLRVITHYYILSLAVSDLLVGLVSMPIWLSYELTGFTDIPDWINQVKMIEAMEFIDILSCISSIVNLAAISVDRFFGIVTPLKHKALMTEKAAIGFISCSWLYSTIIAGMKFLPNFRDYMIFNFVAGYAVPLLTICSCYSFIFLQVKRHARRKMSNQLSKQWTLARTISIVVSLFLICWTPFFVIVLMYQYCLTCTFFDQPWFEYVPGVIKTLHYFNSCCNPFVYGVFNVNFRSAYKGIFYRCMGKEVKPFPYDISVIVSGRNASLRRDRSNTSCSILSYMDAPSTAGSPTTEHEELLGFTGIESRVRTSSFSHIAAGLPRPLSPKRATDEPRMLLRQKFQKQASLEGYSSPSSSPMSSPPSSPEQDPCILVDITSSKSSNEILSSISCSIEDITDTASYFGDDGVNNDGSPIDIDALLSGAKESDI